MSSRWGGRWGGPKYGRMYTPKRRICDKVEKLKYRARYERRVEGRAHYNCMGKLIGVEAV